MADADQTLKILIQLGLMGEKDAVAAKQLLDETSAAGKKLGESMGVITVSTEEANKILAKSGDKAEMTHRGFRRLAHTIGGEIPGAAALMEAGFEASAAPMMGATFLLIGGIQLLKSSLEKMAAEEEATRKITEAMMDTAGKHSEVIDKQRAALEQAEVAEAEFYHNLARNTRNAVDEAEKLAEAMLKTASATDASHADKRKGLAEGRIKEMEEQGVISHAEALKMKELLDVAYEERKMARQVAADKMEEQLLIRKYQSKSYQLMGDLPANVKNADQAHDAAVQKQAGNTQRIAEADEKIKAAQELKKSISQVTPELLQKLNDAYAAEIGGTAKSLPEQWNALARKKLFSGFSSSAASDAQSVLKTLGSSGEKTLALYEGAEQDIVGNTKYKKKLQAAQPGLDKDVAITSSDLTYAREQLQATQKEVVALKDQIAQLQATHAIKNNGAMQDLNEAKASAELKADESIASRVQHGDKTVTKAEQQRLIADASLIAGHQVDLKTAAKTISAGATNIGVFMGEVKTLAASFSTATAEIAREVANIKRQLAAGGGPQTR